MIEKDIADTIFSADQWLFAFMVDDRADIVMMIGFAITRFS
jgi:hypothetical protein